MNYFAMLAISASVLFGAGGTAWAGIKAVASIKPVHSLVSAVMEGVGEADLIVEGGGSPHAYSLRPSQALKIEKADVIFWIGPQLETFLEKPIETIGAGSRIVSLADSPGLVRLKTREGGTFERENGAAADSHASKEFDPHLWLDPENAKALVGEIRKVLAEADPANARRYDENARAETARLDALTSEVETVLAPVRNRHFIVFHDAYQYFEHRFGLAASGSITVSPEIPPGAVRIGEIQAKIRELGAICVFAEPEFEPKLVSTVIEGGNARSGVLDPLGAGLKAGPEMYFELVRNLANSARDCLAGGG